MKINLTTLYIFEMIFSVIIFLIFNVKLLYQKYILKEKDENTDLSEKIIDKTDKINPWSGRYEVSYKFSLNPKTPQGRLVLLIGCFIPIINSIFSLFEICIIFNSEDVDIGV
jgi:hypothetical protein